MRWFHTWALRPSRLLLLQLLVVVGHISISISRINHSSSSTITTTSPRMCGGLLLWMDLLGLVEETMVLLRAMEITVLLRL
jgi:hypothetical protein